MAFIALIPRGERRRMKKTVQDRMWSSGYLRICHWKIQLQRLGDTSGFIFANSEWTKNVSV